MQSLITRLNKVLKKYLLFDEIEDILLFGSVMKGKDKPSDIDLMIIFKDKINKKLEYEIRNKLSNIEINSIIKKELFFDSFIAREGLFLEGYSFKQKNQLSSALGFISVAFFKYDLSKIKGSNRTRFYYALMGRGKKEGILPSLDAKRFSENVIVCNYSNLEKLKDFFNNWNIEYFITPSLVPERLKKRLLD